MERILVICVKTAVFLLVLIPEYSSHEKKKKKKGKKSMLGQLKKYVLQQQNTYILIDIVPKEGNWGAYIILVQQNYSLLNVTF